MLTPRQRELVELAATLPTKVIARRLGISPQTVRNTLHRAYVRLGVSERPRSVLGMRRRACEALRRQEAP